MSSIINGISSFTSGVKHLHYTITFWYNKQPIHTIIELAYCVLGVMGVYSLIHDRNILEERVVEDYSTYQEQGWRLQALKMVHLVTDPNTMKFMGNLSAIGGALTTSFVIKACKWSINQLLQKLLTPIQLEHLRGKNFSLIGARLYLLVNLTTIVLGLPINIQTCYDVCCWVKRRFSKLTTTHADPDATSSTKLKTKKRLMASLSTAFASANFLSSSVRA